MSNLFIAVLNMSLKASYVITLVVLIRLLLKRAPKYLSYTLWIAVAFRLTVPFAFESILSLMPKTKNTNPFTHDLVIQGRPQINNSVEAVDRIVRNPLPVQNVGAGPDTTKIYMHIAAYIWIIGLMVLLVYSLISVIRLKKRLKGARLLEDNIYEANNLTTPFVLGIIKPRIYLPDTLNQQERTYIVLHEQTHIRRKDHIIKIVAFIILSIHWFNPLVWIAFILMSMDMELSCDEYVLKEMKEDIKKPYANTLLSLATGRHIIKSSPLAFGEGNVKGRIKNVLNYKRPSFWMILVTTIAVVILSIALISNPREKNLTHKDKSGIDNTEGEDDKTSSDFPNQEGPISDGSIQEEEYEAGKSTVKFDEAYNTVYDKVKIKLISDIRGFEASNEFETSNNRTVAIIDWVLRGGERVSVDDGLINNNTSQYQIILSNNTSKSSYVLFFDTLYDKAYIGKNKGLYEVEVDFARYIDSFMEYTDIDLDIDDKDAVKLFEEYGWTLDYKINSLEQKINNINTLAAFNPNAYYFAYNNELSKDIGLDMSGYSNASDITVDIYRIYESMPREFYPIQNSRAIVIKDDDKIIGAFISAGRHSAFNACSLKGNSFEQATGRTINEWLKDMVRADEFEEGISTLDPEQVIEGYVHALDNKDQRAAQYYISRSTLINNLTVNMSNEELYNEGISLPLAGSDMGARSGLSNIKSAKLLKVEPIYGTSSKTLTFNVTMDIQYKKEGIISSGEQFWTCIMVYETPQTGWKILEFGH
jgi:beta-lactamase regulating signal transducer with metallopeptidase domain